MVTLFILVMIPVLVFSDEYTVEVYPENGRVVISGNLPSQTRNTDVVVQVAKDGVSPDLRNFSYDNIIFAAQIKSGTDGAFKVDFYSGKESGKYNAYISTVYDEVFSIPILFANSDDNKNALSVINESAKSDSISEFVEKVKENADKLAIDLSEAKNINETSILSLLKDYIKNNPLAENEGSKFVSLYKASSGIEKLNEAKAENIHNFVFHMPFNQDFFDIYNDFSANVKFREEMTKRLTSKSIGSFSDAQDRFIDALVLSVVKYPGNYSKIKPVLEKFEDETGIAVSDISDKTIKNISGKDYSSLKDLKSALGVNDNSSNSGGSGGGSSGGGGGKNSTTPVYVEPIASTPEPSMREITKAKYDDLNLVPWATEAITALSDKDIVNGMSERKFAPNDMVLREQFAKMLVAAIGADNLEYKNHFNDVPDDEWYCRYVNIAFEMGIVKGIGDGKFGVESEITRQDMAVMLYNTILYVGNNLTTNSLSFADESEISDYAKNAVSGLCGINVINGYEDGSFRPLGNATRAEAACVIYRALEYLKSGVR